MILLRIKPCRETDFRYLVFNRRTAQVTRVDAIGESCVQLPEDHGIVFRGGYFLQNGEMKIFADRPPDLKFKRRRAARCRAVSCSKPGQAMKSSAPGTNIPGAWSMGSGWRFDRCRSGMCGFSNAFGVATVMM